ncbi:MAG: ribonuclease J [Polyangiales bacterium]
MTDAPSDGYSLPVYRNRSTPGEAHPRAPSPESVRIVPLGGLGEVGMNCLAIEHGDDLLAIDCGVTFPDRTFGVDVAFARLDYLVRRRDRFRALIITHGHEDHIGAVPYLLREVAVPIYAPPYAMRLIEDRLAELPPPERPDLRPLHPARSFGVGSFEIEAYRVHHSIPDAMGLVLRTPVGTIVHTGDFKIEESPVEGQHFDRRVLERAADQGVRLLLSDSTNIDSEGRSGAEEATAEALEALVVDAPYRVVVTTFASNIHRLAALVEVARRTRRRICLLGRSAQAHARIAEELGLLPEASRLYVPPERARRIPREELLVVATGSQGEEAAALSRLARDTHPELTLDRGDRVVFSSRVIPGSERTVLELENLLEKRGIEIRHRKTDPKVHASGHAYRDEQREMLELVRPEAFLPVHGTYHHLAKHAAMARELGIEETAIAENGSIVELTRDRLAVVGQVETGRVHAYRGEILPDDLLKDRRLLAELGIAFIAVPVSRDLRSFGRPRVVSRGFVGAADEDRLLDEAEEHVRRELIQHRDDFDDAEDVRDRAARSLKRFLGQRLSRKPLVTVVTVPHA